MNFRKIFKDLGFLTIALLMFAALNVMPLTVGTSVFSNTSAFAARAGDDEQRAPPAARSSQTLSKRVSSRVFDIMEARDLEDYVTALDILGELKEMYDDERLNDRETYTMWLFYATIAQTEGDYPLAIEYWGNILSLGENLTPDQIEQALISLGSLNFVLEDYRAAIDIYLQYNEVIIEPSDDVYLRLGTAYYQLDEYEAGIPHILRNMELVRAQGEAVTDSTYSLLRAMYYNLDQYPDAYQILKEMVVLFNDPNNWIFMSGLQSQLEMFDDQAYTYYVANAMGYLDEEQQLMNLGAQLFNNDNPYGAAILIEGAMADGTVVEDEDNLSRLSLYYQVAREDQRAVGPLLRAAEMADDGDLYNRLGVIYSNMGDFESSADAFDQALSTGDLDRPDQIYIRLASVYLQLNRFDEGIAAAREAGKDERSEDTADNFIRALEGEKRRYEAQEANRALYEGYFL